MSSVCAALMLAASREQTASHRVLGNEDDNGSWNMAGFRYVNPSRLVTALFIAACVCKKTETYLKNRNNMFSIPSPTSPSLSAHVL